MNKIITKNTLIIDVVKKHPETAEVFFEIGMHCLGCPMSSSETIEEGAKAHGIKIEKLLDKINKKINK